MLCCVCDFFFFKQKTAYEMRISDWSSDVCSSDLLEVLEEYEASMREDNCVDFNDLILKPLLAFERDPKMARAWARQFDAIMVDEYQDTNKGQYRLLRFLTEGKDNVLLLGDDEDRKSRSVGKEWVSTCRSRWSPYT